MDLAVAVIDTELVGHVLLLAHPDGSVDVSRLFVMPHHLRTALATAY